jgi:hypothetical protein
MKSRMMACTVSRRISPIHENPVDCVRDLTQAIGSLLVLTRQIADPSGGGGIASSKLGKDLVFLRMMVHLGVDFEIADDRANDLVVGTPAAIEDLQLALKGGKQFLDIAVLS